MLQLPECLTLQMEHFGFHDFRFLISDSNHSNCKRPKEVLWNKIPLLMKYESYCKTQLFRLRTVTRNQLLINSYLG